MTKFNTVRARHYDRGWRAVRGTKRGLKDAGGGTRATAAELGVLVCHSSKMKLFESLTNRHWIISKSKRTVLAKSVLPRRGAARYCVADGGEGVRIWTADKGWSWSA